MLEDEQAGDFAAAPQAGGEAGGVLPGQVTQAAEPAHQRLQEAEDDLTEGRLQRLWRRNPDRRKSETMIDKKTSPFLTLLTELQQGAYDLRLDAAQPAVKLPLS